MTNICEDKQGDVSVEFCQYTLYKTTLALAYVHSQNIIMRDIKSDNVCVNEDGDIKLIDFGYSVKKSKEQ